MLLFFLFNVLYPKTSSQCENTGERMGKWLGWQAARPGGSWGGGGGAQTKINSLLDLCDGRIRSGMIPGCNVSGRLF